MDKIKLGKYMHYKGKMYEVLGLSLHTETNEKLVLYKPLYDCLDLESEYSKRPFFVRPYKMFFENVIIDGKSIPRFKYIE